MAQHRLIVFAEPVAGREDEFNKWYEEVHLREVIAIEGFVAAQRFKLSDTQFEGAGDGAPARYMVIYEIEASDLPTVLASLEAGGNEMHMSEAIDPTEAKAFAFSALGERVVAG